LRPRQSDELEAHRGEFVVDPIDRSQRDLHHRLGCRREGREIEAGPGVRTSDPGRCRRAVVEEDGVRALQPAAALVDERLVQPDP
jgi:hypothetical protein